jgi:hypothetical protein
MPVAARLHYERTGISAVKPHAAVATSDDRKPGAILDFDAAGDLVAIEILDASHRVSDATRVDFDLIGH